MLRRLSLKDFVIVPALELDFAAGFSALTGETGAGKSILIDALQLALGSRGDAAVVREGAARAEISAEFDRPAALAAWLEEAGFDTTDGAEDTLLLRRVIDAQGKSRAWINGGTATVAQLRELAQGLGLNLFETQGRRLVPTAAGLRLAETVRALGACWQQFEDDVAALQGLRQGRLRIAAVTTTEYFLPDLLGPFARAYPGIAIELAVENRDAVVARLQRGDDELAAMMLPPAHLPLARWPFLENPLVLIAPAVDMTEELMRPGFTKKQLKALAETGRVDRPSQYSDEPYPITAALLEDGKRHLLFGRGIDVGVPITVLQGDKDRDVPREHTMRLVQHLLVDPVTVTLVPPAAGPEDGEIDVTVGAAPL